MVSAIPSCCRAGASEVFDYSNHGDAQFRNKTYSKSAGYDSIAPDASELNSDSFFWVASCTKLIGTIAVLQYVERGQISLDKHVERILPELANLDIIKPFRSSDDPGNPRFTLEPSTKKITLRQLLCHTSGLSYDTGNPLIAAWRVSRQMELLAFSGKVVDAYVTPLLFELGEGWAYSGGTDLACEVVTRLNKISLEQYMRKHIFGPLGISSTTFRLELYPELKHRLVKMTKRTESGVLAESIKMWPDNALEDCGGVGLYSTSNDYARVLENLLKDKPTILRPETVGLMFAPQLQRGSFAMRDLHNSRIARAMTGVAEPNDAINFGLGSMYMQEDVGNYKKDFLVWGGLPNLYWFACRAHGIAGFYASQVTPPGDSKSVRLAQEFFRHVYQLKEMQSM
ncbi:beta-lactamase family protein [Stemphylium lycopersici]|nr:beta-lactamase family protein [Stemphylium lycopersici]